jgi:hypothetical protein
MEFFVVNTHPTNPVASEAARTDFSFDESVATGDAPTCPVCSGFVGMLTSLPPFRVHLETWGSQFGDCAFWLDSFLVSERFVDAFLDSGLKGLTGFQPVEVLSHRAFGRVKGDPPTYFLVVPNVGPARIDAVVSGVEWGPETHPKCPNCLHGGGVLKRWQRIVIDLASWQGDDIFIPYVIPGTLMVSSRFRQWAELNEFTNLIFAPASQSSHDLYPWEASERN